MADPMTNMEIEDVLSSIRRLVSEDLRPGFRAESPVEPAVIPEGEGKLVLTPAFRVAVAPPVAKPDEAQVWRRAASRYRAPDQAADQDQSGTETAEDLAGEPGDTGFSEIRPEARGEAPPDAGQTDAGHPDANNADAGHPDAGHPDAVHADEAHADAARADEAHADAAQADALFIAMADDGDLGPDTDLSGDADNGDGDGDAGLASFTEPMAAKAVARADPAVETGDEDAGSAPFGSPNGNVSDAATLEAAIAELEAAVAASGDDWEPDGSEVTAGAHFILPPMGHGRVLAEMAQDFGLMPGNVAAGPRRLHLEPGDQIDDPSKPVWSDRAPPAAGTAGPAMAAPAAASMFAADEAVLDEGMLRELVIEVIRQELQGALGERITRNVRKLVRAEIHRAIAGREFE